MIGYDEVIEVDSHHAAGRRADRRSRRSRAASEPFFFSVGFFETHRQFSSADLGPRLALLAAAGEPPRHARDAPGHGGLQGQRPLARPGDRRGAQRRSHEPGPRRADADHLHDRPRPRLPRREGHAVRPRHRRDAAHARPGRLHRRAGATTRWSATSTSTRRSARSPASSGRTSCRARSLLPLVARRGRPDPRRDLHRDDLPRRLRAQRAMRTERWKYIRRFDDDQHPVLANCDDSASKELLVEAGWADQLVAPSSSTTCPRPERGPQPGRGPGPRERPRRRCASASPLDEGDRRPAARRPDPGAARAPSSTTRPGVAERPAHGGVLA